MPVIYQHIQEHRSTPAASSAQAPVKTLTAWTLTFQKPGGPFTLFFQRRQDCFRVEQQKFYYQEINRGRFFPSKRLASPFQNILQVCTAQELPASVQTRFYPFADKH